MKRRAPPPPSLQSVFGGGGDSDKEEEKDSAEGASSVPPETQELIRHTAEWMLKNPDRAAGVVEDSKSSRDERLSFLWKEPGLSVYKMTLAQLRAAEEVKAISRGEPEDAGYYGPGAAAAAAAPAATAVRRSRWGQAENLAAAGAVATAAVSAAAPTSYGAGGGGDSRKRQRGSGGRLALPETLDAQTEEQLRQQRQLKEIERKIREAAGLGGAAAAAAAAARQPVETAPERLRALYEERLQQYEALAVRRRDGYGSGDEGSGGEEENATTREHRERAKEMLRTAESALAVTLHAQGSHLGSYLPRAELDSVIAAAASTASTGAPAETHESNRLDAGNIGFQMLKSAGWKEGEGLGKSRGGTANPVGVAAADGRGGLGVAAADAAAEAAVVTSEDPFDEYRKRMQLAYRFRPNPMNNPRRNYYS